MTTTVAMTSEQQRLYERIRTFQFDEGQAVFPFSARLARDNGWSAGFAARVVTEYRRFVFLAVAVGHPVSPSDQVDQVWHLHLLYTESYWPGFPFCQPDQGLHTPTRLSARQISSAHVIPLPTPVRWGRARRETDWSPCFQGISQAPLHTCALSSPLRCTQAARQPPGTGSAQILRSMSPNSRRVRCPSASRSQ